MDTITRRHRGQKDESWFRECYIEGEENACWEWKRNRRGDYGRFAARGKHQYSAHKFAWELHNNQTVPKGLVVRHTCDNRGCVNPKHLILGTHADNMRDGHDRARFPRGEQTPSNKITETQAKDILQQYNSDPSTSMRSLAKIYGLAKSSIRGIINGQKWAYLNVPRTRFSWSAAPKNPSMLYPFEIVQKFALLKTGPTGRKRRLIADTLGVNYNSITSLERRARNLGLI